MGTHKPTKTKSVKVTSSKMKRKKHNRKGTSVNESKDFKIRTHYRRKPSKK